MIGGEMAVWRQVVGWCHAKQARDIRPGDVLIYNYGSTAKVESIEKETAKTVTIAVRAGTVLYRQRKNKDTWIAVTEASCG
jgi:hypothetical protein